METQLGPWTLCLDVAVTRRAYRLIEVGSPELCGCEPCLNFAANRERNFPAEIVDFLDAAGIPIDREAEVFHNARLSSGLHSYGGWFHFVGEIASGPSVCQGRDGQSTVINLHDFESGARAGPSTKTALVHEAFGQSQVLQLEFAATIPWIIDADEPE